MRRPDILLHICCAPCLARSRMGMAADGLDEAEVAGWFFNPNIHPLIELRRRIKALRVYAARERLPFPVAFDEGYGLAGFIAGQTSRSPNPAGRDNPGAPDSPSSDTPGASPVSRASGRDGVGTVGAGEVLENIDEAVGVESLNVAARGLADADFPAPFARPGRCRRCYARRLGKTAAAARRLGMGAIMSTLQSSREQDHDLLRGEGERAAKAHGLRFLYIDCREHEPPATEMRGIYRQAYCGCVFSEAERYAGTRLHLHDADGHFTE